jgi:hypothetical protein
VLPAVRERSLGVGGGRDVKRVVCWSMTAL